MTALPTPVPTSLPEDVVEWQARRAKARASRPGRTLGALGFWVAELAGTLGAFAAFTVGAFLHVSPLAGYGVLGVSLLVVNAKVTIGCRKRRAAGLAATVKSMPASGPRVVRE